MNPPLITLELHATGAVSSTVLTAFNSGSAAYTYNPNVTTLGQTFDAPTTCSPLVLTGAQADRDRRGGRPRPAGRRERVHRQRGRRAADFHVTLSWPRGVPVSVRLRDRRRDREGRHTLHRLRRLRSPSSLARPVRPSRCRPSPTTSQNPDQSFQLELSNPVGLTLGTTTATGTVHDTSPAPYVIAELGVVHRNPGSGTQTLRIPVVLATRWGKPITSGYDITVHWATGDYTAHAPARLRRELG